MKRVIIMRGLPGSGKSTEAKKFDGVVVSADDYFMINGVYRFNPAKIGDAHISCMRRFLNLIDAGLSPIVVDNTNISIFEVNPYRLVAQAMGYEVEVVHVVCDAMTCAKRNTHGVPLSTIQRMLTKYEPMPAFLGGEREIQNY